METYTVDDLIALRAAMKLGAMEVEYKDHRIKYRSLADMLTLEAMILDYLGLRPTNGRRSRVYASVSKGVR